MFMPLLIALALNGLAFAAMGLDKSFARNHRARISERTLLLLAFCGGGFGASLGALLFRHKTRKPLFRLLLPLSCLFCVFLYIKVGAIVIPL